MLNITLPNQVLTFVEERMTADGFKTPSEYIYHLILQEQERLLAVLVIEKTLCYPWADSFKFL